ncbi:MAG: NAD-dependent epimerase/dehydratase family protein [Streptosporangiaceae bacterium]
MRVLILGGDGYLGWPTALHFSMRGHEVYIVDNYLRRKMHAEAGTDSLTPIAPDLATRVNAWRELTGHTILATEGDLADWAVVERVFRDSNPEAIIHYGEIPSAPYSMMDRHHAALTQYNNVINTLNVLWAMHDFVPDAHLVKLGTMGEYGTPNIDIEEGWIDIHHAGRTDRMLYPKMPASLYHCSKVHDSTNIEFCCRAWGLRATDLNQGVVYGIETEETRIDPRLITRFDYDDVHGTVLNRFCVQAVMGHPLTPYGNGSQIRGFLNIVDTLRCVELACRNPAAPGEFRVFNQFTEQFSINELAELVQMACVEYGLKPAEVLHVENPRVEKEDHYYNAKHTKLIDLGLEPHLLSETLVEHVLEVIERYQHRLIKGHILPRTTWRGGYQAGQNGHAAQDGRAAQDGQADQDGQAAAPGAPGSVPVAGVSR